MAFACIFLWTSACAPQKTVDTTDVCEPLPRSQVLHHLKQRYGEIPVNAGLSRSGGVIEVISSGLTWTIILTAPNGLSCVLDTGEGWVDYRGGDL